MKNVCLLIMMVFTAGAAQLSAQNLIVNGSFENTTPLASYRSYKLEPVISNWNNSGYLDIHNVNIHCGDTLKIMGGFGNQHLDLNGTTGKIYQTVSNLTVNTKYVLSFYSSINCNITGSTWTQSGKVNVTDSSAKSLVSNTWTYANTDTYKWNKLTYAFVATSSSIKITFESGGGSTSQHGILLDSVMFMDSASYYNEGTTSIGNIETGQNNQLTLFPNPSNQVNITTTSSFSGAYHMYNMAGQLVKSGTLLVGENTIELLELKAGVYIFNANGINRKLILN
jgi:hypothetical protein